MTALRCVGAAAVIAVIAPASIVGEEMRELARTVGSWGTLSEIALARRTAKPVVTISGWGVTDETGQPLPLLVATSAAAAVRIAIDAIAGREQDRA